MKKEALKARNLLLTLILTLLVAGVFGFTNVCEVQAAPAAPATPSSVTTTASGQTVIYVKWELVKGAQGYLICRDGKRIIRTSSKATSFKQRGLAAGKRYGFTVRAFKTYNQKQWYNKKTRKWQNSKPERSIRGSSRTVKAYVYSNPSGMKYATTASSQAPVSGLKYSWNQYQDAKGNYWGVDLKWNKAKGAVKYYVYNGSNQRISVTMDTGEYGIRANGKANNTFHVTAVNSSGKESTRKSIIVPGKFMNSTSGSTSGSSGTNSSGANSGSSSGNTDYSNYETYGCLQVPEDKNVTLSYGNATIHLGQTFTTSILNQLKAGATGGRYEVVTRKGGDTFTQYKKDSNGWSIPSTEQTKIVDTSVYMFDIGDYDEFLAVYVTDGKIREWATTAYNMGQNGTKKLTSGMTSGFPAKANRVFSATTRYSHLNVPKGSLIIGGFKQNVEGLQVTDKNNPDLKVERRIGLHYINAYRAFDNRKTGRNLRMLSLNKYLSGVDDDGTLLTYSGPYTGSKETYIANNQRYGSQANAESMLASGRPSDGQTDITAGPIFGVKGYIGDVIAAASGLTVEVTGANSNEGGYLGEACLTSYSSSVGHLATLSGENHKYIGIGMCQGYHHEYFGNDWGWQ